MGLWGRLMLFLDRLRHPDGKPPDVERLERRQDAVAERLDRLMREADRSVRGRR